MTNKPEIEAPSNRYNSSLSGNRFRSPITIERILVPTDLRAESERTIKYGCAWAARFGAHLTLLHVFKETYAIEYMRGPHACEAVVNERLRCEKMLKSIAEEVKKQYPDCDAEVRDGEPCEQIVNLAKERNIDLIVVSTHHFNWWMRLAYGCDAERILRQAPCPIVVLRNNDELA